MTTDLRFQVIGWVLNVLGSPPGPLSTLGAGYTPPLADDDAWVITWEGCTPADEVVEYLLLAAAGDCPEFIQPGDVDIDDAPDSVAVRGVRFKLRPLGIQSIEELSL
ncbi:hypothetical protein AB0H58_32550 [Nocardia neocaledoniensis]|uniref:hypothetical protein n=1 Tax=Nocardia neocaledoniensis TaxID=236511 RepID=UPI0033DFFCC4